MVASPSGVSTTDTTPLLRVTVSVSVSAEANGVDALAAAGSTTAASIAIGPIGSWHTTRSLGRARIFTCHSVSSAARSAMSRRSSADSKVFVVDPSMTWNVRVPAPMSTW